jgi:3-isopropylmalate/(R)-2-methylmalate dehydratase small subunit
VNLAAQTVQIPGGRSFAFAIAAFRRRQLLQGLDEIAYTLGLDSAISAFETAYDNNLPWLRR